MLAGWLAALMPPTIFGLSSMLGINVWQRQISSGLICCAPPAQPLGPLESAAAGDGGGATAGSACAAP
jgi:hypothetical protein